MIDKNIFLIFLNASMSWQENKKAPQPKSEWRQNQRSMQNTEANASLGGCDTLVIKIAPIHLSLNPCPLPYDSETPCIKRWTLFSHTSNLTCDLLWPIECGGSPSVSVPSLSFRACILLLFLLNSDLHYDYKPGVVCWRQETRCKRAMLSQPRPSEQPSLDPV